MLEQLNRASEQSSTASKAYMNSRIDRVINDGMSQNKSAHRASAQLLGTALGYRPVEYCSNQGVLPKLVLDRTSSNSRIE